MRLRRCTTALGLLALLSLTACGDKKDKNEQPTENTENNVHAGIKYLAWIKGRYFDPIENMREKDRVRMALAAYNAGPRTLRRARAKARELGLDPAWQLDGLAACESIGVPRPDTITAEKGVGGPACMDVKIAEKGTFVRIACYDHGFVGGGFFLGVRVRRWLGGGFRRAADDGQCQHSGE